MHDFATKIACDKLQPLITETALREASPPPTQRIHGAAAHSILTSLMLGTDRAARQLQGLRLIAGTTSFRRPGS